MFNDLENLCSKYNGIFNIKEDCWFNGNAYFPLYEYNMKFEINSLKFSISGEYRQADFSKKRTVIFNTFPTESHSIKISAIFKVKERLPKYEIKKSNFISKILRRNQKNKIIDIISKDEDLKIFLSKNKYLYEIYRNIEYYSTAPNIIGKTKKIKDSLFYTQETIYMIEKENTELVQDKIYLMSGIIDFLYRK